jgi:hypothetical protein
MELLKAHLTVVKKAGVMEEWKAPMTEQRWARGMELPKVRVMVQRSAAYSAHYLAPLTEPN